jgi:ATP:corrinoid adenosyltransferase
MPDSIVDNGIKESVANADMKTVAETAAHSAALAMANAVANQQLMLANAIANQQLAQANSVANAQLEQADAVAHQRRMNILGELNLANAIKGIGEDINEPSVENAVSAQKLLTGNDMAQNIAALNAAFSNMSQQLAGIQQSIKAAQTTPPETGLTPIAKA